ncbi:MAG: MFS transporter [Candidatus Heimdallarchaeaceae archaeon]
MTGENSILPENQLVKEKKKFPKLIFGRNEVLILFSFFFLGVSTSMFAPYAPVWLKDLFGVETYFIIGFVGAIPSFVIAFGTWIWGLFADKFGKKPFVLLGIGASGLMYFALMFVQTPLAFLISILVGNIFISAQTANFYAYATVSTSKKKETILGELSASFSLAWLISSPLAATIQDNITSTNQPDILKQFLDSASGVLSSQFIENPAMAIQLFIAVIACIASFIIISFAKNDKLTGKRVDEEYEIEHKENNVAEVKFSKNLPIFILIVIIGFFQQASSGGFWAYSSYYFVEELGALWVQYSYFLIVVTTIGFILSLIFSRITKSKSVIFMVMIMTFLQIFIYTTMAIEPENLTLNLIVYSIPMYVVFSILLYGLIGTHTKRKRRATAFGIFNTIGLLGAVSSSLILGLAADHSSMGLFVVFYIVVGFSVTVFLLSILLMLIFRRNQKIESNLVKDKD